MSFGPKQRSLGEAAKTLETSNYKNTIGSLKRLVGRKLNDPDIAEIESKFITANLVDIDGLVGVKVCPSIMRFFSSETFKLIHMCSTSFY